MKSTKILIGCFIICVVICAFYGLQMNHYLTLSSLQEHSSYFADIVDRYYFTSVFVFISIGALGIGFAIPLFAPLALMGGYVFGALWGMLYLLSSTALGLAASYVVIRYILPDILKKHNFAQFNLLKHNVERHAFLYIAGLQCAAIIPYIVITVLAVLGNVKPQLFLFACLVGSLPSALAYSIAGSRLHALSSTKDVVWSTVIITGMMIVILGIGLLARQYIILKETSCDTPKQ